jgi:hypothetical protein
MNQNNITSDEYSDTSQNEHQYATRRSTRQYENDAKFATKRAMIDLENILGQTNNDTEFDPSKFENIIISNRDAVVSAPIPTTSTPYRALYRKYHDVLDDTLKYIQHHKKHSSSLQKELDTVREYEKINSEEIEQYIGELEEIENITKQIMNERDQLSIEVKFLRKKLNDQEEEEEFNKKVYMTIVVITSVYSYAFGLHGFWYVMKEHEIYIYSVFQTLMFTIIMFIELMSDIHLTISSILL